MANLDDIVAQYIDTTISLRAKDVQKAAASRRWFLTRIRNEIAALDDDPQLLAGDDAFVNFGSYFKGTKVADVDEYDVLVVIDSCSGVFSQRGEPHGEGQGTAAPNHKYDARFKKSDRSGVSPQKILEWLCDIVADVTESFDGEAPRIDGSAVVARIASKDLAIDLVPAGVFTRISDGSLFYNIATGGGGDGWTLTAPREDIDDLNKVAQDRPNLKNVIRIIKRVKDQNGLGISSFALERQVVRYARREENWSSFISIDLPGAIRSVAGAFDAAKIPDLYDPTKNLLDGAKGLAGAATVYRRIARRLEELLDSEDDADDDDLYDAVHDLLENE